jgi:WD40 repeat protein
VPGTTSARRRVAGTAKELRKIEAAHRMHINISRFANHTPYLLATSSFDKTVKMWDVRTSCDKPIYTCTCVGRLLMSSMWRCTFLSLLRAVRVLLCWLSCLFFCAHTPRHFDLVSVRVLQV